MNEITINSVSGFSLPISAYTCDVYGNQCVYAGTIITIPETITLSSQFNMAPALGLKLNDGTCETFEIIDCS
jgi:hypothetical protein